MERVCVDDMPDNSAKIIKYTDTTAYTLIMSKATLPTTPLQQIADDITKWSSDNRLKPTTAKTKTLMLNLKNPPIVSVISVITMVTMVTVDGAPIEEVTTFKLLGVTIDTHLKFSSHVENVVFRCRSKCYDLTKLK